MTRRRPLWDCVSEGLGEGVFITWVSPKTIPCMLLTVMRDGPETFFCKTVKAEVAIIIFLFFFFFFFHPWMMFLFFFYIRQAAPVSVCLPGSAHVGVTAHMRVCVCVCVCVCVHACTQAPVCGSTWVRYGLVWVNTAVHSVAKPLNGINSRWAHKMKDAIYLSVGVST